MERRTFLKLASATAVAAGGKLVLPRVASAASSNVSYAGSLYRAGGAGKIETSPDGGRNWMLHSDLGDMYSITNLAVARGRLRLTVGYAGSTFPLVLHSDKRSWLTV